MVEKKKQTWIDQIERVVLPELDDLGTAQAVFVLAMVTDQGGKKKLVVRTHVMPCDGHYMAAKGLYRDTEGCETTILGGGYLEMTSSDRVKFVQVSGVSHDYGYTDLWVVGLLIKQKLPDHKVFVKDEEGEWEVTL